MFSREGKRDGWVYADYSDWAERVDTVRPIDVRAIRRVFQSALSSFSILTSPKQAKRLLADSHAMPGSTSEVLEGPLVSEIRLEACDNADAQRTRASSKNPERRSTIGEIAATAVGTHLIFVRDHTALEPHALFEIAVACREHPTAVAIYGSEDEWNPSSRRRSRPIFWTAWDMRIMVGRNRPPSLLALSRIWLMQQATSLDEPFEALVYRLFLQAGFEAGATGFLPHPAILAHQDQTNPNEDIAQMNRQVARDCSGLALMPDPSDPTLTRIVRPLTRTPSVSIIIPHKDRPDLLTTVLRGLLEDTVYPGLQVVIVDNGSTDPSTVAILDRLESERKGVVCNFAGAFNFSALINGGVRASHGDIILSLNNDIEVVDPHWLSLLVAETMCDDVGAVGATLLYPDSRIQHAGIALDPELGAQHVYRFFDALDEGPGRELRLARRVTAVTGACLAVRREVFDRAGGFDEAMPVCYNDVDFCLKLEALGLHNVVLSHARLVHHESASRGRDMTAEQNVLLQRDFALLKERWGNTLSADPFLSPNLHQTWRTTLKPQPSSQLVRHVRNVGSGRSWSKLRRADK